MLLTCGMGKAIALIVQSYASTMMALTATMVLRLRFFKATTELKIWMEIGQVKILQSQLFLSGFSWIFVVAICFGLI